MNVEEIGEEEDVTWNWRLPARILSNPEVRCDNDGRTFTFHPSTSFGCVAILGTTRLYENKVHCFEVELYPPFFGEARAIGVGSKQALLHYKRRIDPQLSMNTYESLVGLDENSWGLNYDGNLLHKKAKKLIFDKSWYDPDSPLQVRVTYDACSHVLMYHVNNRNLGVAFENINKPVYPMACSSGRDTRIKFLWRKSFVGTLQSMCRAVIRNQVHNDSFNELPLPLHLIAFLSFD